MDPAMVAQFVGAVMSFQAGQNEAAHRTAVTDALGRIEKGIADILNDLVQLRVFISQSFVDFAVSQYKDVIKANSENLAALLSGEMTDEARKQASAFASQLLTASNSLDEWKKYSFAPYHSVIVGYAMYLKACEFLGMSRSEIASLSKLASDYTGAALNESLPSSIGYEYRKASDTAASFIAKFNQSSGPLWRVSSKDSFNLGKWNGDFPEGAAEFVDTDEGTWALYPYLENLEGYGTKRDAQNAFVDWFKNWRSWANQEIARAKSIAPQVEELRAAHKYFLSLQSEHDAPAAMLLAAGLALK